MNHNPGKLRVLLVDDHVMFREALTVILNSQPDMCVVGGEGTTRQAHEFLRSNEADLVLLDYDLGTELAFGFFTPPDGRMPAVPVVVLSAGMSPWAVRRLMSMGAINILWKHADIRQLVRGIRQSVAAPRRFVGIAADNPPRQVFTDPWTARQRAVAHWVLSGRPTKEIAATLGVSESSVKCTLQQLFSKTGTRSRAQFVRTMLERCKDPQLFSEEVDGPVESGNRESPASLHPKSVA
jgi:two-component system nitrate/nitrite response regulator NarL